MPGLHGGENPSEWGWPVGRIFSLGSISCRQGQLAGNPGGAGLVHLASILPPVPRSFHLAIGWAALLPLWLCIYSTFLSRAEKRGRLCSECCCPHPHPRRREPLCILMNPQGGLVGSLESLSVSQFGVRPSCAAPQKHPSPVTFLPARGGGLASDLGSLGVTQACPESQPFPRGSGQV